MKSFLILTLSMLMGIGAYTQNCSKSRSSSSCDKESASRSSCTTQKQRSCSESRSYYYKKYGEKEEYSFSRFAFLLGPGVNFTPEAVNYSDGSTLRITAGSENAATSNFFSGFSGQADAFLGVRFRKNKCASTHTFGLWGTAGFLPGFATAGRIDRQMGSETANPSGAGFGELEAGFVIADRFRITTGLGSQIYESVAGQNLRANYLSSTAGLMLPLGKRWVWNTSATVMYGFDFSQVAVRPNTGIMLNLGGQE